MKTTAKRLATVTGVVAVSTLSASWMAVAGGTGASTIAADHSAPSATLYAKAGTHYARFTRVCGDPKPHHVACFAIRRSPVHLAPGQKVPAGVVAVRNSLTTGPAGGYTPGDLAALYNFNRNGGSGQTVGIVDWYNDPNALSDLDAFDSNYHFPAENTGGKKTFEVIGEDGSPSDLPSQDASANDVSVEISLDVDAVRAACAQCKIVLVEANGPDDTDLARAENAAVKAGAHIVSNSWGGPEADASTGNPNFDQTTANAFNHPGVAILASTGDDGWYSWDDINGTSHSSPDVANFPSTLPSVVAVGGTFVGEDSQSQRVEGVWNENGAADGGSGSGATGGGCSQILTAPRWQAKMPGYANAGCAGDRLAADVSAIADPATGFDYYDTDGASGWGTVGGTSLASPFLAGMWADAGGPQNISYPALTLYANAASHPSTVHDVVIGADLYDGQRYAQGGSGFCGGDSTTDCTSGTPLNGQDPNSYTGYWIDCAWDPSGAALANTGQCDATTGFDGPSGVGTPNGLGLFKRPTLSLFVSYPRTIHVKKSGSYAVSIKDPVPGGSLKRARWSWGDGKSGSGIHLKHTYKTTGRKKLTITATDNYGVTSAGYIYLKVVR